MGHQDQKMKEITLQGIILQFIMKQREQTHIWSNFLSFLFCQLRQTKHSCKGVLLQMELLPRGTKRKKVIRRLIQQSRHYLTC